MAWWWYKRRGVPFSYDYPPGHVRVSVRSIALSQVTPAMEEPRAPWCNDRRRNGELVAHYELRPAEPDVDGRGSEI
jgi:hypothetical protein